MTDTPPREPNPTGNAALYLGIASASLVFGIGFCALVSAQSQLIALTGLPAYICGAASGFLGIIAAIVGAVGMFNKKANRSSAAAGIALGLLGVCMFFGFVAAFGG